MPKIAAPRETSEVSPAEKKSSPRPAAERTNPATASLLGG
jgi:hypothetical protein